MSAKLVTLKEGDAAPDFQMKTADGVIELADFEGKVLALYFYPRDNTPGCSREASEFNEELSAFTEANTKVLGVSRDSLKAHGNFAEKYDLNFPLGSDHTGAVTEAYGIWVEKKNYGRTYMGIERSTFLIGKDGKIAKVWRKVRVAGHVEDVLAEARKLSAGN